MSDFYLSSDLDFCRARGHQFQLTWSDKHPLKASLACVTCSETFHKNAYVAYGVAEKSFGVWIRRRPEEGEPQP